MVTCVYLVIDNDSKDVKISRKELKFKVRAGAWASVL